MTWAVRWDVFCMFQGDRRFCVDTSYQAVLTRSKDTALIWVICCIHGPIYLCMCQTRPQQVLFLYWVRNRSMEWLYMSCACEQDCRYLWEAEQDSLSLRVPWACGVRSFHWQPCNQKSCIQGFFRDSWCQMQFGAFCAAHSLSIMTHHVDNRKKVCIWTFWASSCVWREAWRECLVDSEGCQLQEGYRMVHAGLLRKTYCIHG